MLPKWHILLGVSFCFILFFLFKISFLNSLIVFLASFLIDTDHYLWWIFKKKNFSLKKAYFWMKKLPQNHKPRLDLFHTVEFSFFIFILSFFHQIFLFILIGFLFHSVTDIFDMTFRGKNFLNCGREFFITRYLLTKNKDKYL